jgi:hypothetical protein
LRLELSELGNRPGLAHLLEWFPHVTALAFRLAPEAEEDRRRGGVDDNGEVRFSTAAGPLAIARLRALAPTHLRHVAYLGLEKVEVGDEAIGGAVLDLMRALPAVATVVTSAHGNGQRSSPMGDIAAFGARAFETLDAILGERARQLEVLQR